jgi:hypothetical protein
VVLLLMSGFACYSLVCDSLSWSLLMSWLVLGVNRPRDARSLAPTVPFLLASLPPHFTPPRIRSLFPPPYPGWRAQGPEGRGLLRFGAICSYVVMDGLCGLFTYNNRESHSLPKTLSLVPPDINQIQLNITQSNPT